MMKLYYAETLNPRKACAMARYLGSPVELVRVDLLKGEHKKPEFLALNPNGKVPTLTDGDVHMWEANAIMCYLAKRAGTDLWPRDDARQLEVMRWLSWNADHFTRHAGSLYFEHMIKPWIGMGGPDPKAVEEATGFFRPFAKVLDEHLSGRKYLLGEHLSVADFAVGVTLPYAEKSRIPLGDYRNVAAWHDRLNELRGWSDPFPAQAA